MCNRADILREAINVFVTIMDAKFRPIMLWIGDKFVYLLKPLKNVNRYQQTASLDKWEKKATDLKYSIFCNTLKCSLTKLSKYYSKLDNSSVYVLSLSIHSYYKLQYINKIEAGNSYAINWQALTQKTIEAAMAEYWPKCFKALLSHNGQFQSHLKVTPIQRQPQMMTTMMTSTAHAISTLHMIRLVNGDQSLTTISRI
ncbi:hypothetical protein OBBRIDRAFT_801379 [Obba rivulosa]|uniref:Uncharacterized protein n=1 Tax=Obba rivulosa TaxID=1052685 RepID=A0A8E2J3U6_9APHY|nr:hypothetical protein OBBRIDRAFT_801379 [Obba rivulosa]